MYLASNLSYLRLMKHKTQEELAAELNISQSTIANYEAGRREPSLREVIKLSRSLGVSIDDLLLEDMCPSGLTFGHNLQYLRKRMNMKSREIANILGVSGSTYSKYENGLVEPNIEGLVAISKSFGVTVDDLLKKDLSIEA